MKNDFRTALCFEAISLVLAGFVMIGTVTGAAAQTDQPPAATTEPQMVTAADSLPAVFILVDPAVVTPDGDGQADLVILEMFIRDFNLRTRVDHWQVTIFSSPPEQAKAKQDSIPVRTYTGKGTPPPVLVWDATNQAGEKVAVGRYSVELVVVSGESPYRSPQRNLEVR